MYDNPLNQMPNPSSRPPPVAHAAAPPVAGAAGFAPQPYAPPAFDYDPVPVYEDEGSYGLGMALGICFGLIVLVIVMAMAKSQTKRGAMHGFLGKMAVVFVLVFFALLSS